MTHLTPSNAHLPTGSFDAYLQRAFATPMLTEEEEQALARRYRDHKDIEAAKQLVFAHVRFVAHIAKSYHQGFGLPWSDLVQEGSVGLMKAVKRFDPDKGVRFAAFAVHWIKAELHDYVCRNWRIAKTFTTKAHRSLLMKKHKIMQHLGGRRSLSDEERAFLATTLGVSQTALMDMEQRLSGSDMPYDAPINDTDEVPALSNLLADEHYAPAKLYEGFDWHDKQKTALAAALAKLDARGQDIIQKRWLQTPKASLSELAKRHNISIERVRQIEKSVIGKLKDALSSLND